MSNISKYIRQNDIMYLNDLFTFNKEENCIINFVIEIR